jgi:hypothetical protein
MNMQPGGIMKNTRRNSPFTTILKDNELSIWMVARLQEMGATAAEHGSDGQSSEYYVLSRALVG